MGELFLNVIRASLYGGIVVALVLVLRLVLKRAPRSLICLLWLLAGLRLLCPFEIESSLSLQPSGEIVAQSQRQQLEKDTDNLPDAAPVDRTEVEIPVDMPISDPAGEQTPTVSVIVEPERNWAAVLPWLWLTGACGMGLYSLAAYLKLRRRVREAVKVSDGVYECAGLETAFILGYFRPRIYVPMGFREDPYILAHERAHIRRGDHWFKLLMFAALAIHWFNPLVWVAYLCLCRDLEMACDEAVVRGMDLAQRKAYSAALLACSTNRRSIAACPMAFGEVSVKQRIISVLNYRKPRFWICLIAVAAIVFVAVCFLTNPTEEPEETKFAEGVTLYDQGDVPDWVRNLGVEEVASLEMTVFYSQHTPYRKFEGQALADLVEQLHNCHGAYLVGDETIYGSSTAFYIEMKDGTLHQIANNGRYLSIDGVWFDAADDWLDSLPSEGETQIPDTFDPDAWEKITEAGQALERCRRALEEFQSRDSWYLTCESVFQDYIGRYGLPDTYENTIQFWQLGDDWFTTVQGSAVGSNPRQNLEKDGVLYSRDWGQEDTDWYLEEVDTGENIPPWVLRYRWNWDEITFLSQWEDKEGDWISFVVDPEGVEKEVHLYIDSRIISFHLSASGKLQGMIRDETAYRYTGTSILSSDYEETINGMTPCITHMAYTVQETDPAQIKAIIDEQYQEAKSQT